ncbi:ABC transporter permease [Aminobacter sp. HY435]|uniref:ABC transporter permease n=1 Tax=Aminobacter sp. HY435 TaxID=2970917 RepID=UPI0022B99C15|nr:ABC transporter permease [Aminobacter sp. HY435]
MQSIWGLLSFGPDGWGDDLLRGVFVTVSLALVTLPLGLLIGFFVALSKQSSEPSLRLAGNIYTTIFRGLPELLTLFLVFYGAQIGIQQVVRFISPDATVEINSFVAGMIALGVVFSSYASEVFLSAFRAIPKGQYEGGYSVGLSPRQTMRLIILPQLVRIALPGLSNLWLILLKDTALVSAIGLTDIVRQASIAARVTKQAFLFFGVACLIYLALAIISSFGIAAIERRVGKREATR